MFYDTWLQKFKTYTKKGVFTDHKAKSEAEIWFNRFPNGAFDNNNINISLKKQQKKIKI